MDLGDIFGAILGGLLWLLGALLSLVFRLVELVAGALPLESQRWVVTPLGALGALYLLGVLGASFAPGGATGVLGVWPLAAVALLLVLAALSLWLDHSATRRKGERLGQYLGRSVARSLVLWTAGAALILGGLAIWAAAG